MSKYYIVAFFILFYLLGLAVFRHYGISWDEPYSRNIGRLSYLLATFQSSELLTYFDKFYGTGFELPLYALETWFGITLSQQVYYLRHLAIFSFYFLGTIVFYKLARLRFRREISTTGVVFLIVTPRMFANSFYNSKDIVFLSGMIIAVYTMMLFLKNPAWKSVITHSLASAFLVSTRVVGVFIVAITLLFLKSTKNRALYFIPYILLFGGFTILFWPYLWSNPIKNFLAALSDMMQFQRGPVSVFYLGEYIGKSQLPWHYVPLWILITTPFVYLLLFVAGVIGTTARFVRLKAKMYSKFRLDLICLVWFFGPLIAAIIFKTPLYDDWRQLYFIYPALILIALVGLEGIFSFLKRNAKGVTIRLSYLALAFVIVINLISVTTFMIRYHPYQNLYFNFLSGGMENAKANFDIDYWGLTYREGLEYIARNDKSAEIKVFFDSGNPETIDILEDKDRIRFFAVKEREKAKYILKNFRYQKPIPANFKELYSVKIENVSVMTVYASM